MPVPKILKMMGENIVKNQEYLSLSAIKRETKKKNRGEYDDDDGDDDDEYEYDANESIELSLYKYGEASTEHTHKPCIRHV